MFLLGWIASVFYLRHNPGKGLDPREIVVDEVAGQWLLLSVLFPTFASYLVGFILFRIFDIIKPWPVCWADREIKGALGVMFDDFLAAMYPILVFLLFMIIGTLTGSQQLLHPLINFLGGSYVQ
jgi:phosphatidylglycerophosphatase A